MELAKAMEHRRSIRAYKAGTTIEKSVIEELGGFDEKMPASQDYEMWLRIARKYAISYVKEPLVRYYVHEGEQITKNREKKREGLERLNDLNMDYLINHPKAHSIRLLREIPYYQNIDRKKAKKLFWKAVRIFPVPNKDLLKSIKFLYLNSGTTRG